MVMGMVSLYSDLMALGQFFAHLRINTCLSRGECIDPTSCYENLYSVRWFEVMSRNVWCLMACVYHLFWFLINS